MTRPTYLADEVPRMAAELKVLRARVASLEAALRDGESLVREARLETWGCGQHRVVAWLDRCAALSAPREDAHAPPPMCPVCRNGTVIAPWNCVCNGVAPAPVGGSVAPRPKERCAECGGTGEIKRTGWPDERCPCGGRGQR